MPSRIAVCYCRALRCCRDFYYFRPGLHFATGILTISGWVFVLLHVLFVCGSQWLKYNNFCDVQHTCSATVKIFVTATELTPFLLKSLLQIWYWSLSCENPCCIPGTDHFPVKIPVANLLPNAFVLKFFPFCLSGRHRLNQRFVPDPMISQLRHRRCTLSGSIRAVQAW